MRLEVLGKLTIFSDLIGSRTRDFPTCSIMQKPSTLARTCNIQAIHIASLNKVQYPCISYEAE